MPLDFRGEMIRLPGPARYGKAAIENDDGRPHSGAPHQENLCQNITHHLTVDIRKPVASPLKLKGKALMIDA